MSFCQLARRRKKAAEAKAELEEAKEIGEKEDAEKMAKRTVRVGKEENEDVKKLLRLMGVPIVEVFSNSYCFVFFFLSFPSFFFILKKMIALVGLLL